MAHFLRIQLKQLVVLGICALCIFLGTGCSTISLPAGIQREKGIYSAHFDQAVSPYARYSYITWFLETAQELPPDLATFLQEEQVRSAQAAWQYFSDGLENFYGNFVQWNHEDKLQITPYALEKIPDLKELDSKLELLQKALRTPQIIAFSEMQLPLLFPEKFLDHQAAFQRWFGERQLTLVDTTPEKTQKLASALEHVRSAVALKARLLEAKSASEAQVKDGNFLAALDLLDAALKEIPENATLESLRDSATLETFRKKRHSLPFEILQAGLRNGEASLREEIPSPLSPLERQKLLTEKLRISSDFLRLCKGDSRFAGALAAHEDSVQRLAELATQAQGRLWGQELENALQRKEFWQAARFFHQNTETLQQRSAPELYLLFQVCPVGSDQTFAQRLAQEFAVQFRTLLPAAFQEFGNAIDHAANIMNKHGICVILCDMLQEIIQLNGDEEKLPPPLASEWGKIKEIGKKSLALLRKESLQQKIFVRDLSSGIPGLGLTYARDLENVLRKMLQRAGLDSLVRTGDSQQSVSPRDYLIFGGIIADYDGNELIEQSTMRSILRHDEIQTIPNPDFNPEAPKTAPKRLTAQYLYRQNELEQIITRREIQRLAHLRIFFNLKGPGIAELLELNEFYSEKFIVEQSHLFNDIQRKRVIEAFDKNELIPPESLPVLQNDRIWTAGESLDFARKDSLNVFALKILRAIQYYPLFLAQRGEKAATADEVQEAADLFGKCALLAGEIRPLPDLAVLLDSTQPLRASCASADVEMLFQQQKELEALQKTARARAFEAADQYLRQKRNP